MEDMPYLPSTIMNKTYLFIGYDASEQAEISEFITSRNSRSYFAGTNEQVIHILDDLNVDTVVIHMHSMNDAVILRYVNRYYPGIKVVVSANKDFDEVISIFRKGIFSRMPRPFRLEELDA
jgi:DNA-binding NtrC family response regulator